MASQVEIMDYTLPDGLACNGFRDRHTLGARSRPSVLRFDGMIKLIHAYIAHGSRLPRSTVYMSYYNEARTHLSLGKDAPINRPIQRFGRIISAPILGGLHHQYCRI